MIRRRQDWNAYNIHGHNYDTRNYYRAYRKKRKNPVTEKKYREIIEDIFKEIIDNKLMKYVRVKLPYRLGDIFIEDVKCGFMKSSDFIWKQDLVNWPETLKLWRSDKSLRKKRIYVYLDLASFARFRYWTYDKCFWNARFYDLVPNRKLSQRIFWELTMKE